jgi:hypothetical protein
LLSSGTFKSGSSKNCLVIPVSFLKMGFLFLR